MLNYGNGSTIPGANAATGAALTATGTQGLQGALSNFSAFNPNATVNTDSAIAAGKKYAAGMDIPGAVQAAMRDATQTARDVTLPGIEQNAGVTGNTDSSRTALAQGLVQRGLAQKASDISSSLYNDAYSTGVNNYLASEAGNNAQRLAGITGAGALSDSMLKSGVGANSQSLADAANAYNIANTGGAGLQQNDQNNLTNKQQQYQSLSTSPFDAVRQLMQIVGAGNYGSSTVGSSTSSTTSTPSAWQVVGGLMGSAGSLFGKNGLNLFG